MTNIDNSRIFHTGVYTDMDVYVPANTTYKAGTVLGRNSSGKLTAFSTDLNVAAHDEVAEFVSEPLYILAQPLTNATNSAVTVDMARVFEGGEVDAAELTFVKTADKTDIKVLDKLHCNGFRLLNVEETCE